MTIEIHKEGGASVTGDSIPFFQMLQLKYALKAELYGMSLSRRGSAYAAIKRRWKLKGTKQSVYEQFCKIVDEASAKQEREREVVLKAVVADFGHDSVTVRVFNEDRTVDVELTGGEGKEILKRMNRRGTVYFHSHVRTVGEEVDIKLGAEVTDQRW